MTVKKLALMICIIVALVAVHVHCGQHSQQVPGFHQKIIDTLHLGRTILGVSVIKTELNVPWDMIWGPDNKIWYSEQDGKISRIDPATGSADSLFEIPGYYRKRLALASIAFYKAGNDQYVFINHLFLRDTIIYTRIARYTYNENAEHKFSQPLVLLEYPGHAGHNGSRMVISPDGKLMVATGDIFNEKNAQDTESVSGKILRLNIDGSVPDDNPVKGSPMWAMGFRVPQGLVYSEKGNLYSAEHGDATDDEVNLITKGSNYGYPNVTGACDSLWEKDFCNEHGVKEPLRSWTPTIAPSGIDYYGNNAIPEWKNSLLAATLKTQSLRVLKLNDEGNSITADRVMFENRFGRLRDVLVSPDGDVYLSTSNRDWNPGPGFPLKEDDRIIRVFALDDDGIKSFVRDPQDGLPIKNTVGDTSNTGQIMYLKYCASCHKADGKGVEGSFPSLRESPILYGQKDKLIAMVLGGSGSGEASRKQQYDQQMPSFSFMPDSEIAGILNYVRREFGNMQEKLFPGDVRKTRLTLSLPGNRK